MIQTGRLTLRPWREGDRKTFSAVCNTPAVMHWLGGVQTDQEQQALVERQLKLQAERGHCFWVVERKEDAAILGMCGLKLADAPGCTVAGDVEIGWRLREDSWGQGYAREAASASLDFAFDRLAAPRVIALTCIGNTPSWGLMERLGMSRRADLDFDDPRYGADLNPTIVYVIARDQWR
jgi:RimJ/RimL family protein N-acetyltransferase